MKRLLIVIVLLAAPAWAEEPVQLARMSGPMLGAGGSGGPACSTTVDSDTTGSNEVAFCNTTRSGVAVGFTTSEGYSVCKVLMKMRKGVSGSPDQTISLKIYASSSGALDSETIVATADNTFSQDDLSVNHEDKEFLFNPPVALTSGTLYFIALETASTQASGIYLMRYNAAGSNKEYLYQSGWVLGDASSEMYYITYK